MPYAISISTIAFFGILQLPPMERVRTRFIESIGPLVPLAFIFYLMTHA